ncbi:hypothetical protein MTP99_011948 [Tenebrio molitor]|nr:hypothetical protein MTP99_011948 [Tenebrio molitor]
MHIVKTYFGKRVDTRVNIDYFLSIQLKILHVVSFYPDKHTLFYWLLTFAAVTISSLLINDNNRDLFEFQQLRKFYQKWDVHHVLYYSVGQKQSV